MTILTSPTTIVQTTILNSRVHPLRLSREILKDRCAWTSASRNRLETKPDLCARLRDTSEKLIHATTWVRFPP
jgi:hypothetical protein